MAKRKPPRPERPPGLGRPRKSTGRRPRPELSEGLWLYGVHPVLEALANPARTCRRLLLTEDAARRFGDRIARTMAERQARGAPPAPAAEQRARAEIAGFLPDGAVHQGLALLAEPLAPPAFEDVLERLSARPPGPDRAVILVLDQVTDPQNVGAVLRSAAAFGAAALVTTQRHAPPESGALAKAASGALEHVPYVGVTNLARALAALKDSGCWILGLAGEAERPLAAADPDGPVALVLGAEGPGLRRLTREACDLLARLPTRPPIDTLNVSTAAAVALYELLGRRGDG
jgi:23S rRNA (guanosine2251-2'-O)-methyltransferase